MSIASCEWGGGDLISGGSLPDAHCCLSPKAGSPCDPSQLALEETFHTLRDGVLGTGGTELGAGDRAWEVFFPCHFPSILCFGAPGSPVFQPNTCEPPGPLSRASCLFLGNSLKFQTWPSGCANSARFVNFTKWLVPQAELGELTPTTPRWGKLPRGYWCWNPAFTC